MNPHDLEIRLQCLSLASQQPDPLEAAEKYYQFVTGGLDLARDGSAKDAPE